MFNDVGVNWRQKGEAISLTKSLNSFELDWLIHICIKIISSYYQQVLSEVI